MTKVKKLKKESINNSKALETKVFEPEVLEAEFIEVEAEEFSEVDDYRLYEKEEGEEEVIEDFIDITPDTSSEDPSSFSSEADQLLQLEILKELLPVTTKGTGLVTAKDAEKMLDPLQQYIKEIGRHKLLSIEEEKALVATLQETGDIEAAKKLVVANLRLVVKIAMEYRNAHKNVLDLIQEGNVGLMKAVSKYNPDKGAKLSYYASWWIKSYILKFILDNFRLIKIGTTAEQKKLFYNLMREKDRLKSQGIEPKTKLLSQNLGVSEKSVAEMDFRLSSAGAEFSIDQALSDEANSGSYADYLASNATPIDEALEHKQSLELLQNNLQSFLGDLKDRDQEIFKKRLLSDIPQSLQSIANEYGVSRERIRQIEERLLKKLKVYMSEIIR